jgi:hypothetical protein
VTVQHQDAPEAVSIRRAQDIFDCGDQRADTQAEGAGIFQEIRRAAKIQRRGNQHAGLLGSGVRQGERDLNIRQQAQVAVLLGRTEYQNQPVLLLEIFFDIHPVQVFYAHRSALR